MPHRVYTTLGVQSRETGISLHVLRFSGPEARQGVELNVLRGHAEELHTFD